MADFSKVASMLEWLGPKNVKSLKRLLELKGYYRKFIRNYGHIAAPLTTLLKKNLFSWNKEVSKSFLALKAVVSHPQVLKLPGKLFTIECDISGMGIGVVLMWSRQPISPISYLS